MRGNSGLIDGQGRTWRLTDGGRLDQKKKRAERKYGEAWIDGKSAMLPN